MKLSLAGFYIYFRLLCSVPYRIHPRQLTRPVFTRLDMFLLACLLLFQFRRFRLLFARVA